MTEQKKLALLRKRNDELTKKVDSLIEKLGAANAEKEHYESYNNELAQIKSEFEKVLATAAEKQMEYDRLIAQAKVLKQEIYNRGFKVKIPFFTKVRLFFIMHKR